MYPTPPQTPAFTCIIPDEKDHAGSWSSSSTQWFQQLHARSYCSIAARQRITDNMSVIKHEKKRMAFRQYTKFVADLNPGCFSLGAKGLNACRVEVTP